MNKLSHVIKDKYIITLIIILGLSLGLIYVGIIAERPIDEGGDEKDYHHLGISLASGKGFVNVNGQPTSRRAPLPSAFFALVYLIFGHKIMAARIAQAIVGGFTCFVLYLLGKEVFSKKAGLFSAAISAVYPPFIVVSGTLLSESVLIFLLVLSVYILLRKKGSPAMNHFLAGVSFGLASLTRPSALLLPFVIISLSSAFNKFRLRDTVRKIAILAVGMAITILPWTIRNYHVHKQPVLINTQLGYILLCSYFYPDRGFGFENHELSDSLTKGVHNEVDRSRILTRYVIQHIIKNPLKFIKLLPLKFLWFWEPFDGRECGLGSSYNIFYGIIFLFFLFGLAGSRPMWRNLIPIYTILAYFIISTLIFYGSRRFRLQIEPFIIMLASYGIIWIGEEWRKKNMIIASFVIMGLMINVLFFLFTDDIKNFSRKTANIFGYNAFSKDR